MKKLTVIALSLFAFAAAAEWTTTTYVARVSSQSEAMNIIAAINSGRINVPGCGGQQEVYAYSMSDNANSFVKSANGSFRAVGSRASNKVSCQE